MSIAFVNKIIYEFDRLQHPEANVLDKPFIPLKNQTFEARQSLGARQFIHRLPEDLQVTLLTDDIMGIWFRITGAGSPWQAKYKKITEKVIERSAKRLLIKYANKNERNKTMVDELKSIFPDKNSKFLLMAFMHLYVTTTSSEETNCEIFQLCIKNISIGYRKKIEFKCISWKLTTLKIINSILNFRIVLPLMELVFFFPFYFAIGLILALSTALTTFLSIKFILPLFIKVITLTIIKQTAIILHTINVAIFLIFYSRAFIQMLDNLRGLVRIRLEIFQTDLLAKTHKQMTTYNTYVYEKTLLSWMHTTLQRPS